MLELAARELDRTDQLPIKLLRCAKQLSLRVSLVETFTIRLDNMPRIHSSLAPMGKAPVPLHLLCLYFSVKLGWGILNDGWTLPADTRQMYRTSEG